MRGLRVGTAPDILGWAARLAVADRRALDAGRLAAGVEVAVVGESLWVRGPLSAGAAGAWPCRLPAAERFELLADGVLRAPGARVPCARLPAAASWSGLPAWLPVALPRPLLPAAVPDKPALRLVRGGAEGSPDALLLDLDAWVEWAERAPAVRLGPLRFAARAAVAPDGSAPAQALVLGQPLPPLPGARLVARGGILVPAGWQWRPAVDAAVVRRLLGLRADELALWPGESAPVAILPAEAVVPASRSAARLTRAQARDGRFLHEA